MPGDEQIVAELSPAPGRMCWVLLRMTHGCPGVLSAAVSAHKEPTVGTF